MYNFSGYKIKKNNNFYILSCDYILQYENEQDESYYGGYFGVITPSCWDDTIIKKIGTTQYYVYHLYGLQLQRGCFNKCSDLKGIHKLTNRPVGVYEDSYITSNGKVYAGVSCDFGVDGFSSNISPLLIIGTELNIEQFQKMFSILKDHNYDFCTPPTLSLLESISACCQQSIVLNYSSMEGSTLTIFCGNTDLCFTEMDSKRWDLLIDVQPVLRRK